MESLFSKKQKIFITNVNILLFSAINFKNLSAKHVLQRGSYKFFYIN